MCSAACCIFSEDVPNICGTNTQCSPLSSSLNCVFDVFGCCMLQSQFANEAGCLVKTQLKNCGGALAASSVGGGVRSSSTTVPPTFEATMLYARQPQHRPLLLVAQDQMVAAAHDHPTRGR